MRRRKKLMCITTWHAITILIIMATALSMQAKGKNASECEKSFPQADEIAKESSHATSIKMAEPKAIQRVQIAEQENVSNDNLTVKPEKPARALRVTTQERYELAKIIMCEAEGESDITKALIAFVVLNRVDSEQFPDNIHDVIFEQAGGCYQFSPVMPTGSWWRKEPDEACYRIVDMMIAGEIADTSDGALYFEACSDEDNWHSRTLKHLYDSDNTRFYR